MTISKEDKLIAYRKQVDEEDEDAQQVESYNDEFTKERFGRENVTVTTTFGFDNSSDDEEEDREKETLFSGKNIDMATSSSALPSEISDKIKNVELPQSLLEQP